jgi:eukaryotic-like serine/threonine-protein kinase
MDKQKNKNPPSSGDSTATPAWKLKVQNVLSSLVIFFCISTGTLVLYILLVDNFAMPFLVSVEQVKVPPLADMTPDMARTRMDQLGLRLTVSDSAFSEQFAAGRITDQSPEPGRQVKHNRRVSVILSRGQRLYPVPTLRSTSLRDTRLKLAASLLKLGRVRRRSSDSIPEGVVISQHPVAGIPLPPDSRIDIEISSGSPHMPKTVPDLRGLPIEQVEDSLDAYEMVLGPISERLEKELPAGIVLTQEPAPPLRAQRHTPIGLVLSVRPTAMPPQEKTP